MALVGDIILSAREQFTDLPTGSLNPPLGLIISATGSGATIPTGSYEVFVTYFNEFGETNSLSSGNLAVTLGQNIQLSGTLAPGASKVRLYFGLANVTPSYIEGTSLPITASATGTPGAVPSRNTAYLPDTDGNALSVAAIYRWLNDGLNLASTICDGLPDMTAQGTVSGQPVYVFPGAWNKVSLAWYDGYPLSVGSKNTVFRRNAVTGFVGNLSLVESTNRLVVECWPQPSRTSGQTTLSADLSATASSASVAASNFVLAFGLVKFGTGTNAEICEFQQNSSGQITGLTRGMGGTVPRAWPSGSAVTELNLMIAGRRAPTGYSVGSATSTFYLPPGWENAMMTYLVSRFRQAEQSTQEAMGLLNAFTAQIQKLNATKIVAGPRQIPMYGTSGPETAAGLGTIYGGVLIP